MSKIQIYDQVEVENKWGCHARDCNGEGAIAVDDVPLGLSIRGTSGPVPYIRGHFWSRVYDSVARACCHHSLGCHHSTWSGTNTNALVMCRRRISYQHNDEHGAGSSTGGYGVGLNLGQSDVAVLVVVADLYMIFTEKTANKQDIPQPKGLDMASEQCGFSVVGWVAGPTPPRRGRRHRLAI